MLKAQKYPSSYLENLKKLIEKIEYSEAILIGAGAGLSTAAGLTYSGKRFTDNFKDFIDKYGFKDMYTAGFYKYETLEEHWAYWSRHIYINRYENNRNTTYLNLLKIVKNKNYFVLTTNVDHQFQIAKFDKNRLFYTQGDYGLWQCSKPCHKKTYYNEYTVKLMIKEQENMRIPSNLIPYCHICKSPMSMNLRADDTFVEDDGWNLAKKRYEDFLKTNHNLKILYLELGVGQNTPGIIKYPFWQMAYENKNSTYACVNLGEAFSPKEIEDKSICIDEDISRVLEEIASKI